MEGDLGFEASACSGKVREQTRKNEGDACNLHASKSPSTSSSLSADSQTPHTASDTTVDVSSTLESSLSSTTSPLDWATPSGLSSVAVSTLDTTASDSATPVSFGATDWAEPPAGKVIQATGFHDLPGDVLANVFLYFPETEIASRLALVCRAWHAASKHPRLWRRLAFRGGRVPTSVVCRLLRTAPQLRALRLDAVPNATTVVRQLCRCNPEVQEVTIRNCTFKKDEVIPETVFRNMIVCCPKIVTLDLKGTQFKSFRFYQELIHLQRLRSLNVGANRFLKVQDLMTVALNCRGLQELKVARRPPHEGCGRLSDADALYIFTHLKASLVSLALDAAGLGDAALLAIVKCTQLRKLGLINARLFTGDRLRLLEENLHKLTSLKLTNPCLMEPHHFRYLFSGQTSRLRHLVKLSLVACWGLQDSGLQAVVETCKDSLQSLSLKFCKTMTSEGIRYAVHRLHQLRRLNVAFAIQGGVADLEEVPQCMPLLQKLVVDEAYRKGPALISLHCRLPTLTVAVSQSEYSNEETILMF